MRKATDRNSYSTRLHPVAVAILNRQAASEVILHRISEHKALTAHHEGCARWAANKHLSIMAHVGLCLVESGLEPQDRSTFAAGLGLLDNQVERSTTTAHELVLLRRMVAAHDLQREQIGRGDYLKALQLDAEPDPGRLRAVFRVQMKGVSDCDGAFDGTQETGSEKYPLITTPSQSF